VDARPRRLTVTEIETWLRDPYAIYAKHVLRLRPLDPLDQEVGPLERGNALHRALELFVERHPGALPPDALEKLLAIAEEVFADMAIPRAALALWRPRFASAARWFLEFEAQRRSAIVQSWLERKGQITLATPGGDFRLVARADRIDQMTSGGAAILDYKTGALPKTKDTATYLMPQLALEGAMLIAGGFEGVPALEVEELLYVKLSGGAKPGEDRKLDGVIPAEALAKLAALVARFDDAATPYPSRLRPYRPDSVGDYDHLARVREWSSSGWSEDE
jgi:ATP-dependent helicase/nuclease subunit B